METSAITTMTTTTPTTFQERLKETIGPRGYDNSMRRSVQSVILYEAHRCLSVANKLSTLRPFQRKLAFFDQANALLDTLLVGNNIILQPHQRMEIMWRTATSKECLIPDVAWKRMRLIDRELNKLRDRITPFWQQRLQQEQAAAITTVTTTATSVVEDDLDPMRKQILHNEACDNMIQDMYETVTKGENNNINNNNNGDDPNMIVVGPRPLHWEHAHNNVMLVFRMYYRGNKLDPNFPKPNPPRNIVVPTEKPGIEKGGGVGISNSGYNTNTFISVAPAGTEVAYLATTPMAMSNFILPPPTVMDAAVQGMNVNVNMNNVPLLLPQQQSALDNSNDNHVIVPDGEQSTVANNNMIVINNKSMQGISAGSGQQGAANHVNGSTLVPAASNNINYNHVNNSGVDEAVDGGGGGTITTTTFSNNKNNNNNSLVDVVNGGGGDDDEREKDDLHHHYRRQVLAEIREHLHLLKQFEGFIPQEHLNQRKRNLFTSLPPAPPITSTKNKSILFINHSQSSATGGSNINKKRKVDVMNV